MLPVRSLHVGSSFISIPRNSRIQSRIGIRLCSSKSTPTSSMGM